MDRVPTYISLYTTLSAYPEVDFTTANLLASMAVEGPSEPTPEPVVAGSGFWQTASHCRSVRIRHQLYVRFGNAGNGMM